MLRVQENYELFEMSNVRGFRMKNPRKFNFSFYFSSDDGNPHGIRVKPVFNPNKISRSLCGELRLNSGWQYTRGRDDKNVDEKDVREMKAFFREYIVLFCMVWDEQLTEGELQDYLQGDISWQEMIEGISFYEDRKEDLDNISNVKELEEYCRENNLVNFHSN